MTKHEADFIVVGGGVVGASIAYGLLSRGLTVNLLDEGDDAFRAARGNFGLVWVQGKGSNSAAYARWTVQAAARWQGFSSALAALTGIDVQLQQRGGLHMCLDDSELAQRDDELKGIASTIGEPYPYEMLDRKAIQHLVPSVGPDVVGGSFCPMDGHANPLRLLKALHAAVHLLGGAHTPGHRVEMIEYRNGAYELTTPHARFRASRIVLAAGLGNRQLAPMVGMRAPVEPIRGQVLVCERALPFLDLPTLHVRQTGDGGIQIGDSKEDVGFDDGTSLEQMSQIAARAVRCFPDIANLNVVRAWGALRVMTGDGLPIYEESSDQPGAFVVSCHSGITLAATHTEVLVHWLCGNPKPDLIAGFNTERFDVQAH